MKQTNKNNRKYKKKTNKRRRRRTIKKTKGGDKLQIVVYPSELKYDNKPVLLYDLKTIKDFPENIYDTMIVKPYRDIEESLHRLNLGINDKKYFKEYPLIPGKHDITEFEISHPVRSAPSGAV
jgi:hypothetical protein